MKLILSLAAILILHATGMAQDCSRFFFMQNNKTIEMTHTNKKGKETGKTVYVVSDVKKTGAVTAATLGAEMFDAKGKSISKASNMIKCSSGVMMMDIKLFIPAANQEQIGTAATASSEVYIDYPPAMKEGDVLKDGQFSMDFKQNNGMNGSVSIAISDRKVAGKETVTTPAGTWDCFKITYHSKIVIKILVGIPVNVDVTEYYAPGFGVVKSESKAGKSEITSIK